MQYFYLFLSIQRNRIKKELKEHLCADKLLVSFAKKLNSIKFPRFLVCFAVVIHPRIRCLLHYIYFKVSVTNYISDIDS